MPVQLTTEQLNLFFIGQSRHRAYEDTVTLMKALKTHADGELPEKLIKKRRPSESEETFKYRKEIYVAKTKNPIGKVLSSLSKIRRSPDWAISYDEKTVPASIVSEETLENYCEKVFPGAGSLTNWVFSVLLKNQLVDANCVVAVFPLNWEAIAANEYFKPLPMAFNSDQIIYYEEGAAYAVLQSHERSSLTPYEVDKQIPAGKVFYVLTTTDFFKYEQGLNGQYFATDAYTHNFGALPVFKVKAQFLKQMENCIIQESRLSGMIPSLDEAAREYSDLQAAVVQHMHPLFWYFSSKACGICAGTGKIVDQSGDMPCTKACTVCSGTGKIKFSPYAHLEIEPPKLGEQATPAPPAGYIGRDVEIMKLQDERVDKHLYEALAAINMQFLDQTPLNISGEAKNVDREELNNFVYNVAEDLIATMDQIYYWINEWRYSVIVPDKDKRTAMLPKTSVPQNFDLLPSDYLIDEITKGKNANANPLLVATMEREYAVKKFYNNPELADYINLYYDLNPLQGLAVTDQEALLLSNVITQQDCVIASYLSHFLKRALTEDETFGAKSFDEKMKVMQQYADEKIKANDAAEKLKQQQQLKTQMALANNAGGDNAGGQVQPNNAQAN